MKQNLVLLPDNKFENLPPSLKENEIIFLGEQHNIGPLIQAASRLVVYAVESCYGLGPFMEAASLGNPKTDAFKSSGNKPIRIPECI